MDNGQDANTNPKSFEDMSNASANSNDTILLHKAQPMHQRGEKQPQLGVDKGGTMIVSCALSACQASSKAELITEDLDKRDFYFKSDHKREGNHDVFASRNKFADDVQILESKSRVDLLLA